MIAIEGHCTYAVAIDAEHLLMFTSGGYTYAVISFSECGKAFGVFLVVSKEEYEAWAEFFCR